MPVPTDTAAWHSAPCSQIAEHIDDLLDGRLDHALEAFALAHMERCPPCRVLVRHSLRYREAMRRVRDGTVAPPEFVERLRFALRRGGEPPPH